MPRPPAKKRRTVVDSDDEDDAPPPRREAPTRAPPTRRSTASTAPKPKPAPKKPTAKKKLTGQYTALHQFFGVPQGGTFPTTTTSPTASQNEDVNDLIEDSDDGGGITVPPKQKKDGTLGSHLPVSKPGVENRFGSLPAVKETPASTRTTKTTIGAATKKQTTPIDARTWPEIYEPKSVEELALNKTKVKEVRTILEDMLDGTSRKRILVLTGPAGAGKTATINVLAKEMGVEILEWRNPSSSPGGEEYGEGGAFAAGLSGLFEEFIGRAGTFGSLELASTTGKMPTSSSQTKDRKVIVIEDFPNTLFTSSATPLQSFRNTLKYFLALPAPHRPIPPLVLIITETASLSGPNSFTAHRLLSPEILHHPLVKEIPFNKIAPSFMLKALNTLISREALVSGRKLGPSKAVLEALSSSGDIRSAIMSLEFLSANRSLSTTGFTEPIVQGRRRNKPPERPLNPSEQALVTAVSQRESSFGLFHAVGKVVYNKRYGDDVDDAYVPPPPRPPLESLPYHPRAVRTDLDTLIDDTGTDPQTFVAALHENYLLSCNPGGVARLPTSDEDVVDTVINCIDNLSDADLLSSHSFYKNENADTVGIRADEISFQTATRGIMLSLPSPVRRFLEPKGGANKMFFPTAARLWKERQEVEEVVDWFVEKERTRGPCRGGKMEALLERMPYLAIVERRKQWGTGGHRLDLQTSKALERTTVFRGVGGRSEEVVEAGEETVEMRGRWKKKGEKSERWSKELGNAAEEVEKLVLSDDDIEEF
jgi:cell cycle checkpoint protein